jgi:electron transport complex protein RnfG
MKSLKKNYIIQAWLVLLLCLFFGSSLAGIQLTLAPKIFENKKNETLKKIPDLVLGESQSKNDKPSGKEININSFFISSEKNGKKKLYNVYEVKDKNGQILGFVSKSSGQGYADKIEILVGFDAELETLTGLFVLDQKETPGLGNKITETNWRKQFLGKKTGSALLAVKTGAKKENEIDAITGATISSRSVLNIVNSMMMDLKEPLKKKILDYHKKNHSGIL